MKKYLNLQDFISFLKSLEVNESKVLSTESLEDGSIDNHTFMKIQFAGETIVLYEFYAGGVGVIQDTPVAPWEDYAESVWEDLVREDEFKVFIEAD